MNASLLTYRSEASNPHASEELSFVQLIDRVTTDDGVEVPEGAEGTVVAIWAEGAAYEVDFAAGLATVEANQLEAASFRK